MGLKVDEVRRMLAGWEGGARGESATFGRCLVTPSDNEKEIS